MINILLPSMGGSSFFKDSYFPKMMYEICGKTMLELVADNFKELDPEKYIFVFSKQECMQFHLDQSAEMLSDKTKVIQLENDTAGALCTCLMAVECIDKDEPLIIANSDQIIEVDYQKIVAYFQEKDADAGLITFPNIHPRWSYVVKQGDEVIEVAEKRPLSKDAIAGFYYFKKGKDFIEAAKRALLKKNSLEGKFYVSASINELILLGKKVLYYDIPAEKYKSFYSPAKIKEYEEGKH